MSEFEFELIFKLDHDEDPKIYLDSLYESGCDDALIGVGTKGYISLEFTSESNNSQDAITDAYKKVLKAIPHALLERAAPDLLNVTQLAYEFKFTKQNMRKYARNEMATIDADFPSPVVSGKTSYWHVSQIALWLSKHTNIEIEKARIDLLVSLLGLNQVIESQQLSNKKLTKNFENMLSNVA